ncbi:sulfatase-like hydrolase/transferase [Lachnospiraceae bacterium NSJ-143]|nr:sulfatase-like hydrolase/transferase [Lachnospiraceae bacterium NSJ-143]
MDMNMEISDKIQANDKLTAAGGEDAGVLNRPAVVRCIDLRAAVIKLKKSFRFSAIRTVVALAIATAVFLFFRNFTAAKGCQYAAYSALFGILAAKPIYIAVSGKLKKALYVLSFIAMPFISFYIVEFLNGNVIWEDLYHDQIILNLIWYFMTYLILLIAIRRPAVSAVSAALIFLFIGTVNHYVLSFRGTVIFPCDIITWRTALNVSGNFDFSPDLETLTAFLLFAVQTLFIFRCGSVSKLRVKKAIAIPVLLVSAIYTAVFFFTPMLPAIGIYAQQWKTQANGFVLNFTTALRYSRISQPDGYSTEGVADIQSQYSKGTASGAPALEQNTVRPKNIIAVMNESFDDFAEFENLSLSEDPAPFFHSLTENTIKGRMYSPVTGGGTANVEYEYLTGNSLSFLPEGTVAYQLFIKDGAPNLAWQMNTMGYETTAFHPYLASGWNRREVYDSFGFDNQIYSEDLEIQKIVRKYISDSCDYEKIFEITDNSSKPQFIFNVTMQNHSAYDKPWAYQKYHVTPDGSSAVLSKTTTAEQYFSLIRESDDAIKELIEHYQNVDEPTLIVFFGDHQPPLGKKFYTHLYGKSLDKRTTDEVLKQYTTPFFIWANYDIPEYDNVAVSSNYLGVLTAKLADIPLTGYQKFLDDMHSSLPVFTNIAVIDSDGKITERDSTNLLTPAQQELVKKYEYLNYYSLFDRGEEQTDSFFYINSQKAQKTKTR